MSIYAYQLINEIENFIPLTNRIVNDPSGLQIGSRNKKITNVLVSLDVRPNVIKEAISKNINFIFSHHPVMFHPAHNLDLSIPQNKMYSDIIKNDIVVYASHTNLDTNNPGMNDWIAEKIGLSNINPFIKVKCEDNNYHYLGRFGYLNEGMSILSFANYLKSKFKLSGIRIITKNLNKLVKKIAIVGGDGGKFFKQAVNINADLYITGDVYYHTAHDMLAYDLSVIDPGHHIEDTMVSKMADKIRQWNYDNNWNLNVIESSINTDPFQFIN